MILYVEGDIFASPAEVLTNTVNTVGAMGKGVALTFRKIYPEMYEEYRKLCESGELTIGKLHVYRTPHKTILNFPTKKHWRNPSKPEYIEAGLKRLLINYDRLQFSSIAMPPLGCGNGGLDFESQVKPLLEKYLSNLPIPVFVYPDRSSEDFVPEHEETWDMEQWLRESPRDLPFKEVWRDLTRILEGQNEFQTLEKKTRFQLELTEDREAIRQRDSQGEARSRITKKMLSEFWNQLRSYGFYARAFSTDGQERGFSYVAPLIARLPYVRIVRVSQTRSSDADQGHLALQILPPSKSEVKEGRQLDLLPA